MTRGVPMIAVSAMTDNIEP